MNYQYGLDSLNPRWYLDAYRLEVGELPEDNIRGYEERFGPLRPLDEVKREHRDWLVSVGLPVPPEKT